jgi:very-short-patch-repair endonuclease
MLLHRLLDYIGEQAKTVDPRGFRLTGHPGFLRRRESMAGLPGVEFDIKIEGDHVWLRVYRLEAAPHPPVPENMKGLIRPAGDPNGAGPSIDEAGFSRWLAKAAEGRTRAELEQIEVRGRKAIQLALDDYAALWSVWAEGEKPRRKSIALYGDLFALKHQIESEETAKPQELVWGMGISVWNLPLDGTPFTFEYPLLSQAVEISLDEKSMAIEVRPRATDTKVEMEAFAASRVSAAPDVENAIRTHLTQHKDKPATPFDSSSFADVLKLAATNLDSHGAYKEIVQSGAAVPSPGENLVVTDEWVLLARPRSNNYLFEDLRRLQAALEGGCAIPDGPLSLVTPPSDEAVDYGEINFRGRSSRGQGKGPARELCFPLPYNEEQVTIVQRLESAPGVAVQGPPGTGKTHTIANIICHYLATGRRVLVTSRGETALQVLREKIPDEVRSLTVALLSSDREGVRQFEASINAIQHRVSQLNPTQTRDEIGLITTAIERAHAELAAIDRRNDEIALDQLSEMTVDGVPMRAQKIAELVVTGTVQHGWFDDGLSLAPEHAPPLSDAEAGQLREARRKLGPDLVYAHARVPSADAMPPLDRVAELHEVLARMRSIEGEVASGAVLALKASSREVLDAAREMLGHLEEAMSLVAEIEQMDGGWANALRIKCRQPSFVSERKALEALLGDLGVLIEARAEFLKQPVEFPEDGFADQRTREAVERGAATGKPFGFVSLGNGDAKANVSRMKVAGRTPASAEDWQHVRRFIGLHDQIVTFTARWNHLAAELSVPFLEGGVAAIRHIETVALVARKAHLVATRHDMLLPKAAEKVFRDPPAQHLNGNSTELAGVRDHLKRHLTRAELSRAATELAVLQEKLAGASGPVADALRRFVDGDLGAQAIPKERIAASYAELMAELRRIAALASELAKVRDFARRIAQAGAERFAHRIESDPVESTGEDAAMPASWREAWTWARMRSHLEHIEARKELLAMAERRSALEGGLARLYRDMVAKSAWLATKRNATPKVLAALAGYATAIRKIGQGTGPNAVMYRRDARKAMLDAADAVPCWIMSHARISEAMPPEIGAFDLVVVDEASQSDLWALPAILRGRKILVVGDDKQVSPEAGFVSSLRILDLRRRFLADQPFEAAMTPTSSLYDLAARVFAAHQVMLREHFRCVPPIIAYSNRTFYKNAIQPLRIPNASERIEPPLVDVRVKDGCRDTHDCNALEAQAITEEIAAILSNERLAGRSIGVVSLLGLDQAKKIDSMVRARCNAAELLHRKFECGDARSFQGSERDIMFLSLVVDPASCKALSGNLFEQRFNVGTSRARDRMYLVRSVDAGHLSDKDLRLTLLSHFDKPVVADSQAAEELIGLCESGFERDVFSVLTSRGYKVTPQVKTGAFRIDMVVEGAHDSRLAIECDGDEFHGPDRWAHDMSRQRMLERAGWTFWRCFASTWSLRKDEVFAELTTRLAAMGIEPLGAVSHIPTMVEKRVWECIADSNDDTDKRDELAMPGG